MCGYQLVDCIVFYQFAGLERLGPFVRDGVFEHVLRRGFLERFCTCESCPENLLRVSQAELLVKYGLFSLPYFCLRCFETLLVAVLVLAIGLFTRRRRNCL